MIIIGCSHGKHLAKEVAKELRKEYSEIITNKFPDGESYVRLMTNLKGKKVIIFQSFYGEINDCIIEVLFAAKTARELGAKKVILVSPYFPYLRQDKRFKKGETIAIKEIGELFSNIFDEIFIVNPHLHRETQLKDIFRIKAHEINLHQKIREYIQKNFKDPVIIGPDYESHKMIEKIADIAKYRYVIFQKKRYGPRKVIVSSEENLERVENKSVIIVDDIISSGHTILEAVKLIKKYKPKDITAICVHGIFAEKALNKIRKNGVSVLSTNTIPNKVSKINISKFVAENLKKSLL